MVRDSKEVLGTPSPRIRVTRASIDTFLNGPTATPTHRASADLVPPAAQAHSRRAPPRFIDSLPFVDIPMTSLGHLPFSRSNYRPSFAPIAPTLRLNPAYAVPNNEPLLK